MDDSDEIEIAKTAMFSKHPVMKDWYTGGSDDTHNFGFWKLELEQIWLVDFFGGAALIDIDAWNRGSDKDNFLVLPRSTIEDSSSVNKNEDDSDGEIQDTHFNPSQVLFLLATVVGTLSFGIAVGRRSVSIQGFEKVEEEPVLDMAGGRAIG